jgi:hypothetical protein
MPEVRVEFGASAAEAAQSFLKDLTSRLQQNPSTAISEYAKPSHSRDERGKHSFD